MGSDLSYASELLGGQLAFLLQQEPEASIASVPGFLQALQGEPALTIHLADLHSEAATKGLALQDEEYDGGNPGMLLANAVDEMGQKLPRGEILDEALAALGRMRRLVHELKHPFVLPFPSSSSAPMGRVSVVTIELAKLARAAPPILSMEADGYKVMVARNDSIRERARLLARTDPAIALLRLEAVATVLLRNVNHIDISAESGAPVLRVQVARHAMELIRTCHNEILAPGTRAQLGPIMEDVGAAARLLVLDLRRRLFTARTRLGVVQRFKARCEWHDRERLRQLADATDQPEHALRDEMTRYLFDQGLNPLAEAVLGTSSRADVFDPSLGPGFYVEAKQYGERSAIETKLREAFRQALDTVGNLPGSGYVMDEAFIVLVRRGGPRAVLPTQPFNADGLRWHFVLINIAEASKDASQNKEAPVEYTIEALREMLLEVAHEQIPSSRGDS